MRLIEIQLTLFMSEGLQAFATLQSSGILVHLLVATLPSTLEDAGYWDDIDQSILL